METGQWALRSCHGFQTSKKCCEDAEVNAGCDHGALLLAAEQVQRRCWKEISFPTADICHTLYMGAKYSAAWLQTASKKLPSLYCGSEAKFRKGFPTSWYQTGKKRKKKASPSLLRINAPSWEETQSLCLPCCCRESTTWTHAIKQACHGVRMFFPTCYLHLAF